MPNIYLVGMMGSGKSETGKKLALLLGYGFADIDELIEAKTRCTIAELFEQKGEPFFRDQEAEVLKEVSAAGPRVVATGGGTILKPDNVRRMRETGKIIYLETSLEALWERVKEKRDRPLLKSPLPKEKLKQIFLARETIYERVKDFAVNTDGQNAEEVARKILERLQHSS